MSLVLYRKYRPKDFSEVVGQDHVIKTLQGALGLGRVAHGYLFTGPRGTGKTTVARLLAKAVNCEDNSSPDPCNKCQACKDFNESKAIDLVEIDAASNTTVDNVREVIIEGSRFLPSRMKRKVYIIDEVHMLSKSAFNALLKTLEEPPAHVMFILATTEIQKVPQTIVSRCQRFNFHKISLEKILERLEWLCRQEKVPYDKKALEIIAVNATGGMRDAESLLGQAIAFGDKISLDEIKNILAVADTEAISGLADILGKKDMGGAVAYLNKLADGGCDMGQLAKGLIDYFRKMLILKIDKKLTGVVASELTSEQINRIIEQNKNFTEAELGRALRFFIEAENEIKYALMPQLPLELAVVELLQM